MFFYSVLDMDQTLSERVALILEELKINQTDLARLARVTRGAVNQWMKAKPGATMKPEAAFELSDKTPYSARWLSIGEGPMYKPSADAREEKLLEAYRATDERGRQAIHRVAEIESEYFSGKDLNKAIASNQ